MHPVPKEKRTPMNVLQIKKKKNKMKIKNKMKRSNKKTRNHYANARKPVKRNVG